MNIKSGFVLLIALAAGVVGGTAAYQVATPTSSSAEPVAREPIVVKKGDRGRDKAPGFAPCKRPAILQSGRCVTDVTRTVVVPGAAAPVQSTGSTGQAPAPVPFLASSDDSEGRHDSGSGNDDERDDERDDDRDDTNDATDTQSNMETDMNTDMDSDMDSDSDDVTDTHGDDDGDDDGGTQTRTRTRD